MEIKVSEMESFDTKLHPLHVNAAGPIDAWGIGVIVQRSSNALTNPVEFIVYDRETGERSKITITVAPRKDKYERVNNIVSVVSDKIPEPIKKPQSAPPTPLKVKPSGSPQPAKKVAPAAKLVASPAPAKPAPVVVQVAVKSSPSSPSLKSPSPFIGKLK